MDHTQNFTGLADAYAAARPAYASALIDELYEARGLSGQSVIADVGSGTGKFSRQLLDRGSFVFGVEPNDDMRGMAVRELGAYRRFRSVCGTEADTGLPGQSVEAVTAAQAFHWFDVERFRGECRRILRPRGAVFLIWNVRDALAEVNRAVSDIYTEYCPRFQGFSGGMQRDDARIRRFFDSSYTRVAFDHPLSFDQDSFIQRSLSSSYSLRSGDPRYQSYVEALSELFDAYAAGGIVTVPNKTVAYMGTVR